VGLLHLASGDASGSSTRSTSLRRVLDPTANGARSGHDSRKDTTLIDRIGRKDLPDRAHSLARSLWYNTRLGCQPTLVVEG
jgi:hypothetical protein